MDDPLGWGPRPGATEPVDWGPRRPTAVSWAGVLMFFLGVGEAAVILIALALDADALFATTELWVATLFVLVRAVLQVAASIGVIRLRNRWRIFGAGLAFVAAVVQATNIAGSWPEEPPLAAVNAVLTALYLLILLLLLRTRDAFA